ncbi:MAG TPA: CBS domain-containing protein, partial [Verrucomicrobiota bacterium]|nr:CBS domain-containing protein [Verrucomicrobiota bacterium]
MANDSTRQRGAAAALPADLADGLERLRPEAAHAVLNQMSAAEAAHVLIELEAGRATRLLEHSSPDQIAAWVGALAPNAAADLAARLAPERCREVLARLPLAAASAVSALLRHPPDSAGGIMDDRFLSVGAEQTVAEGLDRLRTSPPRKSADVAYIYVTDEAGKLVGVVGVRDLLFAASDRRVHEIMDSQVRHLRVTDDQEAITRQIERYRYSALPVVDARQRLVGVVRITDALRVAEAEATEDMQLMVGMSGE